MKYKNTRPVGKNPLSGHDYWGEVDFQEHLKLTKFQTTYLYLLKNYPPPQNILEAGCGIGRWVIHLSQEKYNVTGIEIEEVALDIIRQNYSADNLNLVRGDIGNMDFSDKTFDIIISLGVLEHTEHPDTLKNIIHEHLRVLKDEGIFLVTVPYLSFVRVLTHIPFLKMVSLVRFLKGKKQFFTHYYYSRREFQKILESCHLKVIDIVYDDLHGPYNFGLTIGFPLNRLFRSKDIPYKANKLGNFIFKSLWRIHPSLVSFGIGYICKKHNTID